MQIVTDQGSMEVSEQVSLKIKELLFNELLSKSHHQTAKTAQAVYRATATATASPIHSNLVAKKPKRAFSQMSPEQKKRLASAFRRYAIEFACKNQKVGESPKMNLGPRHGGGSLLSDLIEADLTLADMRPRKKEYRSDWKAILVRELQLGALAYHPNGPQSRISVASISALENLEKEYQKSL